MLRLHAVTLGSHTGSDQLKIKHAIRRGGGPPSRRLGRVDAVAWHRADQMPVKGGKW